MACPQRERAAAVPSGDFVVSEQDGDVVLREVMRHYPTGVAVVAACTPDEEPLGLTATSFTSVSLRPPLVLVCVDVASSSHDRLVTAESFCVNILSVDQEELAVRFAVDPSASRFAGVAWHPSTRGNPILEQAVAWLECEVTAVHPGGDHSILVGRLLETGVTGGEALVFYRGTYRSFRP